jgi:peptidyl-prolyl cis-trans isomerase D
MMDALRRAAQGWTAKILIALLVISFAVWGIADVFRGFSGGTLANVGSQEISTQQFAEVFRQTLQNYSRQVGETITPERAREMGLDQQVLREMIRGAAVLSQANSLKLAIGDAQIAADIARNPNFIDSQGKFDPELVKSFLRRSGQSEASFLAGEREQLLRSAIGDTAQADVALPKAMIEAASLHANEQRDARYFVVKAASAEVAQPSEGEIKKYYEANPVKYTAPEYRSLAVLYAEPSDVAPGIHVSEDDIKAGYEKYKAEFFTPERRTLLQTTFASVEKAAKARTRIANGEDFLAIAKERGFSEQDATWADRTASDILDPAIAAAAFSLNEGELSQPVEGRLAVMLLKVIKVTPEHQQSLDEARAAIAKRLQLDRAREELRGIYDSVEDARAAQTSFEEIAKTANIGFVLVPAIDSAGKDKDGKAVSLRHADDLVRLAFRTDVGVENDAIQTDDDGYVWYEVREVVPSQVRPFEDVKDKVRGDHLADKVREIAIGKAKTLADKGNSGSSLEDLAREAGADIKTVQGLRRSETSQDFDAAAVTALFSVPENGFSFAPEADGQSAKVIQSQAVLAPPFDSNSAEAAGLGRSLAQAAGADLLGSYLSSLQTQVDITVNENLWRNITGSPQQ